MIRWSIILFLALIIGCSSSPAIKKIEKVNTSQVKQENPPWVTIAELDAALSDDKRPDYILLTKTNCRTCLHLHQIMDRMKWADKVLFVNVNEIWVQQLTNGATLQVVPTLIITLDGGGRQTVAFQGTEAISLALFEHFSKKK